MLKFILSLFGVKLIDDKAEAAKIYAIIAAIEADRDAMISAMETATDQIVEVLNR